MACHWAAFRGTAAAARYTQAKGRSMWSAVGRGAFDVEAEGCLMSSAVG